MARPSRRRSSTEGGDADMNIRIVIMTVAMAATAGAVWAKLPAAPADPAKAAEAKAKADEEAKKDAAMLAQYQNKAEANYRENKRPTGPARQVRRKEAAAIA